MRTIPIAAATLALLLSGAASAQTTTPTPRSTTPAPSTIQAPKAPAINPLSQADVSQIEGTSVYGNDDSKIGHVSIVLMDPQSKKIDRLVVAAGGVLGVGSHRVALPLDKFSWDGDKGAFKVSTTLDNLKEMPAWVDAGTTTGSSTSTVKVAPAGAGDGTTKDGTTK